MSQKRATCDVKSRRQACRNAEHAGAVVVGEIGIFSVPSLVGDDGFYGEIL